MQLNIIGVNSQATDFSKEVLQIIQQSEYFAGGKRHYNFVSNLLPLSANWIEITSPLNHLFDALSDHPGNWVIFASGDPLFFGIGNTLKHKFPRATIKFYPSFNSLQLLAHRFKLPYGTFQTISLTGREWHEFDQALISGVKRLGILTDHRKNPQSIAQRMYQYHYTNYTIYYGENLGGKQEKLKKMSIEDAMRFHAQRPNCFFLEKTDQHLPQRGIPEHAFTTLPDRPNMITKLPIRLATLAYMNLHDKSVLWDIGACTGSISVEAKLHYPQLNVHAFEIREAACEIIEQNLQKFQVPGIDVHPGNFMELKKDELKPPDCVFIGGHNNELENILTEVNQCIQPGGVIAFNAVRENTCNRFMRWCKENACEITDTTEIKVDAHNRVKLFIAKNINK